jgi:hypothetical protein
MQITRRGSQRRTGKHFGLNRFGLQRLGLERLEGRTLLAAVSIAPATTREFDAGDRALNFRVSLDAPADHDVTVSYRTQGLTAQSGPDYSGVNSSLVIPAGQTQAIIPIQIHGDTVEEAVETLAVILSNPSAGDTIAVEQAIGIILDDDREPPAPPSSATSLNVLDFGAVGDGTTDNNAAFAAALAAAKAQGKALYVPAGVYAHADLIENDSVDVVGAGIDTVLLATNPLKSSIYLSGTGAKLREVLVTVDLGSTLRQTTPPTTGVLVRPGSSNFVIQNVIIDKAASAGLFVEGAHDGLIDHVTVVNTLADGIHITFGAFNITVQNCFVRNTGDDCIAVVSYENHGPVQPISHHVLIQNNDVGFNPWGRGIAVTGGDHVQILNNKVASTYGTGIYLICESFWQTYGMQHLVVRGNTVTNAPVKPNPNNQPGIEVANQRPGFVVARVTIDGNTVDQSSTGYTGIRVGPDVQLIGVIKNNITTTGKAIDLLAGVTIDTAAPKSQVTMLPPKTSATAFVVRWQGTDEVPGAGVAAFNVLVSIDGGAFGPWQSNVTATSATYNALPGQHTYAFKTQAIDNTGNLETLRTVADTTIAIVPLVIDATTTPIFPVHAANLSASGAGAAGSAVQVVATDNFGNASLPKVALVDDDGAWSVSGINVSSLLGAKVTFTVTATDTQGNTAITTKAAIKGMRPVLQSSGQTLTTTLVGFWGPLA